MRPPAWNSLRLACPPKSSWLSRTRIFGFLPEAIRRRQPADASANNHQIVRFAGADRISESVNGFSITHAVRYGKRTVVVATNPGTRRRIIVGCFFGSELIQRG